MPRRDGAPRRALGSKGPLEGHQAIHVRYRDSSPLKTISPCLILRTLGTEALRISSPLRAHRCKDASLFEAFSCPWTPPSTYYKLLEIERSGHLRVRRRHEAALSHYNAENESSHTCSHAWNTA